MRSPMIVAFGAVVLLVIVVATFQGERSKKLEASRPKERPQAPRSERTSGVSPTETGVQLPSFQEVDPSILEERVRSMEKQVRGLQDDRNRLAKVNQELTAEAEEKAGKGALLQTKGRVEVWARRIGLTETQKAAALELSEKWAREDKGRRAAQEVLMAREGELRSLLSSDQAQKLHEFALSQAAETWAQMAPCVVQAAEIPFEGLDLKRFEENLGGVPTPSRTVLLPEAHGLDFQSLLDEAATRARVFLTPEQAARLREAIAPLVAGLGPRYR